MAKDESMSIMNSRKANELEGHGIKDVKAKIKALEREERAEENLERKIALQEEIATLERKKRKLRQEIFDVEDEIEDERKSLIDALKQHLNAKISTQHLFTFKWKLC